VFPVSPEEARILMSNSLSVNSLCTLQDKQFTAEFEPLFQRQRSAQHVKSQTKRYGLHALLENLLSNCFERF